ncbi:Pleckstrin homology domain-containing family A member 1 [Geodia barretti]|uniref:Pleckstrin homology domain-containing family A member 1 n=1 Tax=Geodia barretti TaxID=519541 RepID=A0AA35W5H9_GEOBA|nr:Pleckstrin homology domain-containing family A member 1 [Geodia barretti]
MSNGHPPSSHSLTTSTRLTKSDREYMNINFLNGEIDTSSLPLAPGSGIEYRHEYVNLPLVTSDSGTGMEPGKEPERKIGNGAVVRGKLERYSATFCEGNDSPPPLPIKQKRSDSYVPASHATIPTRNGVPPRRVVECEQCSNLKEQLMLWELGMSGLTRQYSQILAQLNHARDAAMILECKMKENWGTGKKEEVGRKSGGEREGRDKEKKEEVGRKSGGEREGREKEKEIGSSLRVESAEVKAARRKTMLDPVDENSIAQSQTMSPTKTTTLADQMYPQRTGEATEGGGGGGSSKGVAPGSFPTDYDEKLTELSTRLCRAIDLCQQLAVASFKTNSSNLLRKKRDLLGRKTSTPLSLTPDIPRKQTTSSWWRPLVKVEEGREGSKTNTKRGVLTRMETEPAMKISNSRICEEEEDEEKMDERVSFKVPLYPEKGQPSRSSMAGDLFAGRETQPVRSHMMSLIAAEEKGAGQVGEAGAEPQVVVVGSSGSEEGDELMMSQSSAFSDTDVKQVMTKIALLEDERLKLLETIDQMQNDNQRSEAVAPGDGGRSRENKDLQLTLAMQDLTIATDEIRMVARLRSQLDNMERERQETLEKLNSLEDESAAVKVSLIQLLQEKSATNKTLALENWRLRQAVKQGDSLPRTNSRSGAKDEPPLNYLKDEDLTNYVHKQGFLVKQGRRVKNWKRRLFVLDSTGLSYYKTEQPVQRVSLCDIQQIQVSAQPVFFLPTGANTVLPHMFEVHTPERTFLLSAPSEDEMQSWVGMLQTLKQFARIRARRFVDDT